MRRIVDEMPKHSVECEYHRYNYYTEKDICKKDNMACDLNDKKCRYFKEEAKRILDDMR